MAEPRSVTVRIHEAVLWQLEQMRSNGTGVILVVPDDDVEFWEKITDGMDILSVVPESRAGDAPEIPARIEMGMSGATEALKRMADDLMRLRRMSSRQSVISALRGRIGGIAQELFGRGPV